MREYDENQFSGRHGLEISTENCDPLTHFSELHCAFTVTWFVIITVDGQWLSYRNTMRKGL